MPIKFQFTQQNVVNKSQPKQKSSSKPKPHPYVQAKRKRQKIATSELELFGGKLFEPIMQREREIVVSFPLELKLYDGTIVSSCGRFAYRIDLKDGEYSFDLFFIENPIDILKPYSGTFDILSVLEKVYENNFVLFKDLSSKEFHNAVVKLSSITIGIIRAEIRNERDKIVNELLEKQRKERKDKYKLEDIQDLNAEAITKIEEQKTIARKPEEIKLSIAQVIKKENITGFKPFTFKKVTNINE